MEYYDKDLSLDLDESKSLEVDKIRNIKKQLNEVLKVLREKN